MCQRVFPIVFQRNLHVKESKNSSLLDPGEGGIIIIWNNGTHSTTQHQIQEDLNLQHIYLYYQIFQHGLNLILNLLLKLVIKLLLIFHLPLCVDSFFVFIRVYMCTFVFVCFVSTCTVHQSESLEVNTQPVKNVTFLPHTNSQILHNILV